MKIRTVVLWAVTTTFMGVQLAAAKEPPVAAAPLPSQVVNAKKIFISNAGEDNRDGAYNGGADRAYNQFYAALKSWGHYELASTPADADLIFEISFTMPVGIESGPGGNWPRGQADLKGSIYVYDPQFRVAII